MAIRTGVNAPLGAPLIGTAYDTAAYPLGTIITGFDDVANTSNEYIFLRSVAGIAVGDEVTYDANFLVTEVAAAAGQARAVVASGVDQYAWFKLEPRPVA